MSLMERIRRNTGHQLDAGSEAPSPLRPILQSDGTLRRQDLLEEEILGAGEYQDLKSRVHNRLFDFLDLTRLPKVSEARISEDVAELTRRILEEEKTPFTLEEKQRIVSEIQHEVFGLGPLEPLLEDHSISDILVNGHEQIFVERRGRLEPTVARFKDEAHLMRIIEKILSSVGRRVDESSPMVDARLPDGSRVNVIVPPLALNGPTVSIRRFGADPLRLRDLIAGGSLSEGMATLLEAIVQGRLNVLISGGTGSGKTTLLNALSAFVPQNERIVTIEDSAELQLHQRHVVRLETRPPNIEGRGAVTQRDLLINSLRMRPDRIVVGEVRGAEALDMLQAMNTGHAGSLTTVHANSPRDALSRIETMVAMSGFELPLQAVRQQIASAIDVIVQTVRLSDETRCVSSIQEVTGSEQEVVTTQEIFELLRHGVDSDGRVRRTLSATGIRPAFGERLRAHGISLPAEIFEPTLPNKEAAQ